MLNVAMHGMIRSKKIIGQKSMVFGRCYHDTQEVDVSSLSYKLFLCGWSYILQDTRSRLARSSLQKCWANPLSHRYECAEWLSAVSIICSSSSIRPSSWSSIVPISGPLAWEVPANVPSLTASNRSDMFVFSLMYACSIGLASRGWSLRRVSLASLSSLQLPKHTSE